MNEGRITAVFGIVAAVALGLAWWSKPSVATSVREVADELVGTDIFPKFEDPEIATSLQIVKYDETLAQLKKFEVARDSDSKLWTLPSNDGYPADAAEQVKDATTPLIGLQILEVVAESAADHELYGVVNPDDELAAGASGVGMLVTFKDQTDQVLASLVVGKEVDKTEGQRYVRVPTQDAVYQVEISTDAFTTNFRDWIEDELLGVRSMDINKVGVRDYALAQSLGSVTLSKNFDAEAEYDSASSNWTLTKYISFATGQPEPKGLEAGEEINKEFLNSLRTAVQDLEIVDVQRKPKGLAADLKVDDSLLKNEKSIAALQQQGFFAASIGGVTEIFAAGGETIVGTEEGVDYLLRFGEATASLSAIDSEDGDGGLSRYLLVTAKLNESRFPQPELEPVPQSVEEMLALEKGEQVSEPAESDAAASEESGDGDGEDKTETPAADETPDDSDPAEEKKSEETAEEDPAGEVGSESKEAATKEDAGKEESGENESDGSESSEATESTEDPSESKADPEESTSEPDPAEDPDDCGAYPQEGDEPEEASTDPQESKEEADEAKAVGESDETAAEVTSNDDVKKSEETSTDKAESDEPMQEEPAETQEELEERLEALKEEIARENQRKIDERNDNIDKARKKVLELNARFSEWYYVVGDSAYKKLKITREDLIKKAEPDPAAGNAFPNLPPGAAPGLPGGQLPPFQLPGQQ